MIKFWIISLHFILTHPTSDLKEMRRLFEELNKSKTSATLLRDVSVNCQNVAPSLKQAYLAAAEMALSQYKPNPISKISAFNSGKKLLEESILSDSSNVEIRYIRFTIQDNVPFILGYNGEKAGDKLFLINKIHSIKISDPDLYSRVCTYLLLRTKLASHERALITN